MQVKLNNEVVEVEDTIVNEVIILNEKGYITTACCGGHVERDAFLINIVFDRDYHLIAPQGFKWYDGRGLEWYRSNKKPYCEREYNKAMNIFREWVKNLPNKA